MKIILHAPFASNSKVDERDVLQLKKALNRLGYYQPYEKTGITDFADTALFSALKDFQRDNHLHATGEIKPDDQTLQKLNEEIQKTPKGYYIWRCVEDGKARPVHARMNRTLRAWSDHPDPGEDFNCRCWAQPTDLTMDDVYSDAISPTVGPFDLLSGNIILRGGARLIINFTSRHVLGRAKNIKWIENAHRSQLQSKFKHAKVFGIEGNPNNLTLEAYKNALIRHVKSPDTIEITGTYHRQPAKHYFNTRTRINVIKDKDGDFHSVWELSNKQIRHLLDSGNLGGSK